MVEKTVRLEDLVGEHVLDGVDYSVEGFGLANALRFRLDGVVYVAIEDEQDGYRSMLDRIIVEADAVVKNTFPATRVLACLSADDGLLDLLDVVTQKVVLQVGTDHSEDYYPRFVASFMPEHLAVNQPSGYEG
jgi:hypothetical protein